MSEWIGTEVSLEEIMSSMVKVETSEDIGLEQALQRIGYEMRSQVREEGRIIWIHAKVRNPNRVPGIALALVFSRGGIYHAPKYDYSFEDENVPEARLIHVRVDGNDEEMQFTFEGVDDPEKRRFIKLATKYKMDKWGSL